MSSTNAANGVAKKLMKPKPQTNGHATHTKPMNGSKKPTAADSEAKVAISHQQVPQKRKSSSGAPSSSESKSDDQERVHKKQKLETPQTQNLSADVDEVKTPDDQEASFESLGVCQPLIEACQSAKWSKPTDIQREAIPYGLQGKFRAM